MRWPQYVIISHEYHMCINWSLPGVEAFIRFLQLGEVHGSTRLSTLHRTIGYDLITPGSQDGFCAQS